MMGSVKQIGKTRAYWFEYEYINNKNKWVTMHREFTTEPQANRAHLISQVSWANSWNLPSMGSKRCK